MSDLDKVKELLAEVQQISTARLKTLKNAAKNANLVVIDKDRLDALESLLLAASTAFEKAKMTRDYKDVQSETYRYVGKKWLLDRDEGSAVLELVQSLINGVSGPTGYMVED